MALERDAAGLIQLDYPQVIRRQAEITNDGELAQRVINVAGQLVPKVFNKISVTYITSGPGTGEIGTVIYRLNGVIVATLNLTYDGSNRLTDVERI